MPSAARQPTPPSQPAQQQPPAQQQQDDQRDATVIAAIAVALAAGTAASAILPLLAGLGVSAVAGKAVLALLRGRPAPATSGGVVGRAAQRQAWIYRAAYVLNAARRVDAARAQARSSGGDQRQALRDALAREKRFAGQQQDVEQRRAQAARDTEAAAQKASGSKTPPAGTLVGWKARHDLGNVTPACAAADGNNYPFDRRPRIGYPGTVHPKCRCLVVPPWPNGGDVDTATAGLEE